MTQTALAISEEQQKEIQTGRERLLAAAQSLEVTTLEAEETAWEIVHGIGELRKVIRGDFADSKKATRAAWQAVVAQEKGHLAGLEEPDRIVRGKLSTWAEEKERVRAEAERKAREEAEKVAAEERRVAQEKAQADAEEKRLADALAAEEAGKKLEAEALLAEPVEAEEVPEVVPAVVPKMEAPKVEGAGAMVETWHFEVVQPLKVPRVYLTVDETKIRQTVNALKGTAEIEGVRIWKTLEPRRARR